MVEKVDREMEEMGLRRDRDVLVPRTADSSPGRSGPRENRFGDTISKYVSPPLQEAWSQAMDAGVIDVDPNDLALMTALKRSNDYIMDMAGAGLSVGEAAAKAVAASVGEVFGDIGGQGRSGEERLTEDLMAMPEAFAGGGLSRGANLLDDVLDTGGDAARYTSRVVRDRANQPGPVPVMGSNLGNVGGTQNTAADALEDFSRKREAVLSAPKDASLEEVSNIASEAAESREQAVAVLSSNLSDRGGLRLSHPETGRRVAVSPGLSGEEVGKFRLTFVDEQGSPTNHTVFNTREEAIQEALQSGYVQADGLRSTSTPTAPTKAIPEISPELERLGYDPFLPGMEPPSPADALGMTDEVYHYSSSADDFEEFEVPSRIKAGLPQDSLGVHVGSRPQAAEERFLDYRGYTSTEDSRNALNTWGALDKNDGRTLKLRANTSKPFLNPETDEPFTETQLRDYLDAVIEQYGGREQDAVINFRRSLAEQGYTNIPYENSVEDVGEISHIMLVDRPEDSPAVLRSAFAAFAPENKYSANLSAGVAATAVGLDKYLEENEESDGNFARGGLALKESRKGIRTQAGLDMAKNKTQLDRKKADLDGDGELSEYEEQRGEAIQKAEMDDEMVPDMACGGIMGDPMMTGVDPVSGNEIPVGATAENVRDDIPVNISQDEYVLPAHVVKYHGLKYIIGLQAEAEMGLMTMKMDGLIQTVGDDYEDTEEESDGEGSEAAEVSAPDTEAEEGEDSPDTTETPEGNEIELAGVDVSEEEFEDDETEEYAESAYPTKTKSPMYGMMKKPKVTFIV